MCITRITRGQPVLPTPAATPAGSNTTSTPTIKDNKTATSNLGSDTTKSVNTYQSRDLQNPVDFSNSHATKSQKISEIRTIISEKVIQSSNVSSNDIKEIQEKLKTIGGFNNLDSTTKELLKSNLGIESDENLALIEEITNNPNFKNLPVTFTAMDLLEICKQLKKSGMSDDAIKRVFLKDILNNIDDVEKVKRIVIRTCVSRDIVFHDEMHSKENKCNPFLSDKEVRDGIKKEEELIPIAELKNKTVDVSQHNKGLLNVLGGFIGLNKQTNSTTDISTMRLPRFVMDELKLAQTEDELKAVYDKYKSIIDLAASKGNPTPDPNPAPKPEDKPPPTVEETGKEAIAQQASVDSSMNSIHELKSFLNNVNSEEISYSHLQNISHKLIELGGLDSLDSTTRNAVKEKLGIETDENLSIISQIVSDPNFKDLAKVLSSEKLLEICKTLKEKGMSDDAIKKIFLNGLLNNIKSGQIDRAKEHIKDACKNYDIVFNKDLHTKEYRTNPFLSEKDIGKIKQWEEEKVCIAQLENKHIESRSRHGGIIGGLLNVFGANEKKKTEVNLAKVELPRYIVNELKNAKSDQEINSIIEKYKDIIKNALEVTIKK